MSTHFDSFDPRSHVPNMEATPRQRANRLLLNALMERYGFSHDLRGWRHFTLADEPFPDTYFNLPTGGTF